MQGVGLGIHAYLIVGGLYYHDLLLHGRLVGIPSISILIGEGYDGGAYTHNHGVMDFCSMYTCRSGREKMHICCYPTKGKKKEALAKTRII